MEASTSKPMQLTENLGKKVKGLERPLWQYLLVLGVVAAVMGAGAYAVTVPDSVENDFFFRGDQQTVNSFTAYTLGETQSSTAQSFTTSQNEGFFGALSDVYWGIRVFRRTSDGQTEEITGGDPVAVAVRTGEGAGIQTVQWTPPETNLAEDDALIIRVYQSTGSNNYQRAAEYISEPLNASEINADPWNVNYYTELNNAGGGFEPVTEATFYWGTSTYNSGIENFNYSLARIETVQTEPVNEKETWPGQQFQQSVELTCRADTCENVKITPQACQGPSCTSYQDAKDVTGLSWNQNSYSVGTLTRGQTATNTFTITAENEGDYSIRANTSSTNVIGQNSSSTLVDVMVSNVELTDLQHENSFQHGISEYEVGDTLEFLNTTLTAFDGKAFNLVVSPEFTGPDGSTVSWGPSTTRNCGNLSQGSSCEKQFNGYEIPESATPGTYNITVGYDWENFGPGSNNSQSFELVDVRGTFNSSLGNDPLFLGNSTYYNISLRNQFSTSLNNVNVTVNCPDNLVCNEEVSEPVNLGPDNIARVSYNITAPEGIPTILYTLNATVKYDNPDESKNWTQVEPETFKVASNDLLITTIESDLPEKIVRGNSLEINGSLQNNDVEASEVSLNYTLPSAWTANPGTDRTFSTVSGGQTVWNNITADVPLTADKGEKTVRLESNNSGGTRGDFDEEKINVYSGTSLNLELNDTEAVQGDTARADTVLEEDTGNLLSDQRIRFRDNTSGDILGSTLTGSQGEASFEIEIPMDWEVGNHTIVAEYSSNSSIYTGSSNATTKIVVYDRPNITSFSAEPLEGGLGEEIRFRTEVYDGDGMSNVEARVTYPSGRNRAITLSNSSSEPNVYTGVFDTGWENGEYDYRIQAVDVQEIIAFSDYKSFNLASNASVNVVTDRDKYGPYTSVDLDRGLRPVEENSSEDFWTLTSEKFIANLYSNEFSASTGTATQVSETHDLDGNLFTMTQNDGGFSDDVFEGTYTYSTGLDSLSQINFNSYGSVSDGTWNIEFRNYNTGSWDQITSITNTAPAWENVTVCNTGACQDYLSNNEIRIRVTSTSGGGFGQDPQSYSVDFQELEVTAQDGTVTETERPESPIEVGQVDNLKNRFSQRYGFGDLPYNGSGQIHSAQILVNVSSGTGTGEIYNVENFENKTGSENIHLGTAPQESTQTNPVGTFSTSQGLKTVDVTQAVSESFEAGKKNFSFQLREQNEDESFQVQRPVYLRVNYTGDSEIFNTGSTNLSAYLEMRVQRNTSTGWENVRNIPPVSISNGRYRVDSGQELNLSKVWESSEGFNTGTYSPGTYRLKTRVYDGSETLNSEDGALMRDTYSFEIGEADLRLSSITHENLEQVALNEYEVTDFIDWINVTISNSEYEAAEASADLDIIGEYGLATDWGPNSEKLFGNISAGDSAERRWDNSSNGYQIPKDASAGEYTYRWDTTLKALNAETTVNSSLNFRVYDLPQNFTSEILDSDNRIYQNESVLYNFSIYNPWRGSLSQVNVTVNCDTSSLSCQENGGTTSTYQIGTIPSDGTGETSFNISTDASTELKNYDINASIEYRNPGGEVKQWDEYRNKILRVREPGSFLNITQSPPETVRENTGYQFKAYANNTYENNLTNHTLTWSIPSGWTVQSGSLTVTETQHEPGELVWNNFTASIDTNAGLGEKRINITTENDQGRVDDNFVFVDVYSPTDLVLQTDKTDPAANETVTLEASLQYRNGTPLTEEPIEFIDERTGNSIATGVTNSTGYTTVTYEPVRPYGDHRINASYAGSETLYTLSSTDAQNITVHDRPNITNLSVDPKQIGFGYNTTINASITDRDGLSDVKLEVKYPLVGNDTFDMQNPSGDTWEIEFDNTWQYGTYMFQIVANDSFSKESTVGSTFTVDIRQMSSIRTQKQQYSPDEDVNLTDRDQVWWDTDWDYRRRIEVNETSGTGLTDYPTRLILTGLGDRTSNCQDLRPVEGNELQDMVVESCNPSGDSVIYVSTNVSASATESDLYLYYGNPEATSYGSEAFAYPIEASGTYDPGQTNIDTVFSYNGEESIFRNIDLTFNGDYDSVTVSGYNYFTESYETIYTGADPGFSTTFFQNPRFNRIRVQIQGSGGAFDIDPSFDYNFTTTDNTDATTMDIQDKLPSIITNTGDNNFEGRVLLEVTSNTSGSWETVSTRYNETNPTDIPTESSINFADLWNTNPWDTGLKSPGYYRAVFKLLSPSGRVLKDSNGDILRTDTFRLNEPASEVTVDRIEIYNVTGGNPEGSTSDLEASGENSTLSVFGGQQYRFDVKVKNAETADENWTVASGDVIKHIGLNSSWSLNPSNIFYNTSRNQYSGGSFNGNVTWDTSSGGEIAPGETANFSYVIDIPNNRSLRDIEFRIETGSFSARDNSELEVVKKEQESPQPLQFNLSKDSLIRGESIKAYANWSEFLGSASAEYNITSPALVNNSLEPQQTWTNYTINTDSGWIRGSHALRFYATDFNDNTGSTVQKFFDVYGLASVTDARLNSSRVTTGEKARYSCKVTSDANSAVQNYNVSFVYSDRDSNNGGVLGSDLTNSTGWASITYSSQNLGYDDLRCGIQRNESKYFNTTDQDSLVRALRIVEEQPPQYENFTTNTTKVFKTLKNDTLNVNSFWSDNEELSNASVVEGDTTGGGLTVPDPKLATKALSGQSSWANFTLDIRDDYELKDTNLTVYGNDTSSNVNGTYPLDLEIWGWGLISGSGFRENPVPPGREATHYCAVVQGNRTPLENYQVSFYDNSSGEWTSLGTNTTRLTNDGAVAEYSKSYASAGDYRWKCNISRSESRNIEPYHMASSSIDNLTVSRGDVEPPLITGEYSLNVSEIYRGEALRSFAKWNETIDYSYIEYNTSNSSYRTDKVSEPYTDDWTNATIETDSNWSVGPHEVKTYANDTYGNLNDTLDYLQYDVFGRARVQWISPTGTVEKGINQLRCGVESVQNSEPLQDYPVTFFAGETSAINSTNQNGIAVYNYNSSSQSTGEKTWSCQIGDQPQKYYNASSNSSDSEQITLVDQLAATVSGNLTRPVNQTTLAQNKTFTSNVTVKCSDGDCGEVNTSLRYNSSGLEPDTDIPQGSGRPFHTVGSNNKSCTLSQGENCTLSFEVNATGSLDSNHLIDVNASSSFTEVSSNDSTDKEVRIDNAVRINVTWNTIDFGVLDPGDMERPARNNTEGYNISVPRDSIHVDNLWVRSENMTTDGWKNPSTNESYVIPAENIFYSLNSFVDTKEPLTNKFQNVISDLRPGDSINTYYWINVPQGIKSSDYNGSIYFKANATN